MTVIEAFLDVDGETPDDAFEMDDEDGWKDVEPDSANPAFIGFNGSTTFLSLDDLLKDAVENHGVDLIEMRQRFDLDTFGMIKLINFTRTQIAKGILRPDTSPNLFLDGEVYLKPFVEDDALLYSVDDLFDIVARQANLSRNGSAEASTSKDDLQDLTRERDQLREQVIYYRTALQQTYLEKLELEERCTQEPQQTGQANQNHDDGMKSKDNDSHYFSSYDHNEIHETMLQDTIRTDAYRDFIYENKHLFAGKVVLDVGCGTGILSLFCAKAGASKVIAVDNSAIIDKAREIVFENGLDVGTPKPDCERTTKVSPRCLRGKIEEVNLPVEKVDVIVSEWMGYCLLYEAMLDSVIWARNRYLKPEGLMVPSHAALRLSFFADDDYVFDRLNFWNSVYGFKMTCMQAKAYDDIIVRTVKADTVHSDSEIFLELPLHTVQKEDLESTGTSFKLTALRDIDQLHGFVIHFDILFNTDRTAKLTSTSIKFTTGPTGPETHWQHSLALIDSAKSGSVTLKAGEELTGIVSLRKGSDNYRDLEIAISWESDRMGSTTASAVPRGKQKWIMR
ncbi:MAG: hypothetical protein Q9220_005854 [cf. Caloplaca sp. 1 TL-2023]